VGRIRPDDPSIYRGGSGEPLVLVHGGAGTWRLWKPTIPLLEPHHDVLAITLEGHFGGPPPGEHCSIYTMTDGVERDMDAAGFETAHVAGGSLGGWVALELAKRGRARTVTAIAPGGGWGSLDYRIVELMYRILLRLAPLGARRPQRWSRSPLVRRLLYWHHFAHPERLDPDDCAYMIAAVAGADRRGAEAFLAWGREHGGARDLDRIQCPLRLVFPEKDHVLPRRRYGERLIAAIPHAEVVGLAGAGHAPMADDPELTARTILDLTIRPADRLTAA
jgi:pimeloyl-ACP methyl ester carboxylesterase